MRKPVTQEFNQLKLVITQNWRRAYINDQFFVEVPLKAADDPATPWQIGLQNIEADYVRVYDGDASPGSPFFEQQAVQFPAGKQEVTVDPAKLFGSADLTRLSVQLKDGERMADEVVLK